VTVSEVIATQAGPHFSFELFPPVGPKGEASLSRRVADFSSLGPSFMSMTCGAGGSTPRNTLDWALKVGSAVTCPVVVHQTSFGFTLDELDSNLDQMVESGVKNVMAVRGDVPSSGLGTKAFDYAGDMIKHIKARQPSLSVLAGCYPEGHIESTNRMVDIENLQRKVDAGVDVLVTQLFFNNSHYFDFVGRVRSKGITVPIIPGIMPIQNVEQIKRFTSTCGATIPSHLLALLDQYSFSRKAVFHIGIAHAIAQSDELIKSGAPGVHFYALNRSSAVSFVVDALRQS
jgi:methylenetetrahydrofolate reductase (NADPH)